MIRWLRRILRPKPQESLKATIHRAVAAGLKKRSLPGKGELINHITGVVHEMLRDDGLEHADASALAIIERLKSELRDARNVKAGLLKKLRTKETSCVG